MPHKDIVEDAETLHTELLNREFGETPHVVVVISGPGGIKVRGFGTDDDIDGLKAIATLQLGLADLVNGTLEKLK